MLSQSLTIARNTFVEALRQPLLLILVLASGAVQAFNTANTGYTMGMEQTTEVKGDDKLLLDVGMATIFVLGTLLAAFIATAVMSREIENKTVLTVVSKPVARPTLVLGKYLGVAGAMLLASLCMLVFLLMAIRHGVMSTAADELDQPVLTFTLSAVFIALAAGAWCNYFYSWNFPQTASVLLLPLLVAAYFMVLLLGKEWNWQPLTKDFKPQVTIASSCLVLAILVLCAIATAASTRLGQVMTIVVCVGAFFLALMSNALVGRHVFSNTPVARLAAANPVDLERPNFNQPGDTFSVILESVPNAALKPGQSFYYGPTPNGFPLITPTFPPFEGQPKDAGDYLGQGKPPRVLITNVQGQILTVRNVGQTALSVSRPPADADYVFLQPTTIRYHWLAIWGAVPNLQYFWLLDAVTQGRAIPPSYVAIAALYALVQIVACLAFAVILFQKRDVG